MTDQSEYLKSDKLVTAHYGEENEHYYNAVVPPILMNSLNVFAVCKANSHVVCIRNAYGPLKTFLNEYCREHLEMSITYVKGDEAEEFEHAVADQTDLIILESPSSVVLSLLNKNPPHPAGTKLTQGDYRIWLLFFTRKRESSTFIPGNQLYYEADA